MPIRLPLLLAALALLLLVPAAARAADYVPDEVIVRYDEGTGGGVAARVAAEAGAEAVQTLPGGSEQLAIDDGDSVRETIAELREDPNVAYAVPNWRAHAAASVPNDPGFRLQWNFFGTYGINVPEAWTLAQSLGAPGGRGAVVAVLDSGVAYERHGRFRRAPDLRRSTFVRPWDFVGKDRHPNDVFGHGTHVAGTIAQTTNNGIGTAGIAYNAKIMPLRVLDANGEGDSRGDRPGDPLRRALPRRRDQPVARVRQPRYAPRRSRTCWRRSATRTGAARWWWPRPATRPTSPWPTRRAHIP